MLTRARTLLAALMPPLALALCACPANLARAAPAATRAGPIARMSAGFAPERLGAPTTVSFSFRIASAGTVPPPLRSVQIAFPPDLGLATSGLGLASCSQARLEADGPPGCPPNSRMGRGSALAELRLGGGLIPEPASLALFAGPSPDGYLHLLVYADAERPVYAQLVLSAEVLPGRLDLAVPPIPSLPEGPDVPLVQVQLTLGGGLTYYERVHGRNVAYHPAGVGLPASCPRGGFRFAASFTFIEGGSSKARTTVPCPRPGR